MAGIEGAYLFGSYAARYAGEPGSIPNDIDLLVIGSPDRDDVHDAVTTVSTRLRKDIQVAFRTTKSWRAGTDAFVTTLKSRPLVELDLTDSQETAPR